jgi:flagellum-specific ATP synthase
MEGDDQQDPLVDAVRALLDGHIVLDRRLGAQGHYPAVSILDSLSRLMPAVCRPDHLEKAHRLRRLLAAYTASED